MKKFLAVLLLVVLAFSTVLLCGCNASKNKGRAINSVNHRGYNKKAPENSLSAYRLSKEMGFTMVETDVSFTKDGVPVLLHDDTVDRTSNGSGNIWDLTYDEVRALDFGSWKSKKYAGEKIASFREFVDLCAELQLYPYIEVKSDDSLDDLEDDARKQILLTRMTLLVQIVTKAGIDCTWISFDFESLQILAQLVPNGRFGYLTKINEDRIARALSLKTSTNTVFIDADYYKLKKPMIQLCKDAGLPLEVWTLDFSILIKNLDPYISGVTSNNKNAQTLFNRGAK